MKILITEFINKNSLDELNNTFEIKFDEKLWEKAKEKCIPRKYAFKYPLPTFKTNKRDLSKLI